MIIIFAKYICPRYVTEAYAGNDATVAPSPIGGQRNLDISDGLVKDVASSQRSASTDDVRCATLDDVTAARKSLCPHGCSCSPLDGQEAWTKLTITCSGGVIQSNFTQDLVQLLSRCTSELLELTVTHTPLTTTPEVVCRLSKIRSLNLNNNRLTSLPSNCFTHVRNLTLFSANDNRLTSIQVRYRYTEMFSSLYAYAINYGVALLIGVCDTGSHTHRFIDHFCSTVCMCMSGDLNGP